MPCRSAPTSRNASRAAVATASSIAWRQQPGAMLSARGGRRDVGASSSSNLAAPALSARMRREQRLRRRRDFAETYRGGRTYRNNLLVVRVRSNALPTTRFGFVAGKAVGGAVVRNRVKRRLREAARVTPVRPGLDIIVGAKKSAASAPFSDLKSALLSALRRADALDEVPGNEEQS